MEMKSLPNPKPFTRPFFFQSETAKAMDRVRRDIQIQLDYQRSLIGPERAPDSAATEETLP